MNLVPPISKREREIAIKVMMRSNIVMKWVRKEAHFFHIKEGTPEWDEFFIEHARIYAEKLIK